MIRRDGYRLRLRWPIARGWFEPSCWGDDRRVCIGFVKPWVWVRDWRHYKPENRIVDMGAIPELKNDGGQLYEFFRSLER